MDVTLSEGISGFFGMKSSRKGKVLSVSTMQSIARDVLAKDTRAVRCESIDEIKVFNGGNRIIAKNCVV